MLSFLTVILHVVCLCIWMGVCGVFFFFLKGSKPEPKRQHILTEGLHFPWCPARLARLLWWRQDPGSPDPCSVPTLFPILKSQNVLFTYFKVAQLLIPSINKYLLSKSLFVSLFSIVPRYKLHYLEVMVSIANYHLFFTDTVLSFFNSKLGLPTETLSSNSPPKEGLPTSPLVSTNNHLNNSTKALSLNHSILSCFSLSPTEATAWLWLYWSSGTEESPYFTSQQSRICCIFILLFWSPWGWEHPELSELILTFQRHLQRSDASSCFIPPSSTLTSAAQPCL